MTPSPIAPVATGSGHPADVRAGQLTPALRAQLHEAEALLADKQFERALQAFDPLLDQDSMLADLHVLRAECLLGMHRAQDALQALELALQAQADHLPAWSRKGDIFQAMGDQAQALACFDHVLSLAPDHVVALCNRAGSLMAMAEPQRALEALNRALDVEPDHPACLITRAGAWGLLGQPERALADADRAIALAPAMAPAYINRAHALLDLMRPQEAQAALAKAVALEPDNADAHWDHGCQAMLAGDFENGLPELEWRWKQRRFATKRRDFAQALWLGQCDLRERRILIHAEQGLGDSIQFVRYIPLLAAQGAKVVLEVPQVLLELMRSLSGVEQLICTGQELPPGLDFHCPMMSLPLAFKTRLESIPNQVPYLRVDPYFRHRWTARLGPRTAPRWGIAWSGNVHHGRDAYRSIPLNTFLSGLPKQVQKVSLQREVRDADMAVLKRHPQIKHFASELGSMADTAAIIEQLDGVISVDTSVAHLAAALGKPTWILLPKDPDWRWLHKREDTPWYPTAKLVRQLDQAKPGDWTHTLRELKRRVFGA